MISAFIARAKLRQIISLMEDERAALLHGPLTSLANITSKRAAILDALANGGPVAQSVLGNGLVQIRSMALRNKILFEASVDGMKTASEMLQQLERNISVMKTYTSRGEKILVMQSPGKKDHRV